MIGVALFGASVMTSILQSKEPSDNKSTSNLTSGGCKHDVSMCCSSIEFGRDHEYKIELSVAIHLAKEAGTLLLESLHKTKCITSKDADRADFVTVTDQRIESMIFSNLKYNFPHHHFIGEESSASDGEIPVLTDVPTWIVDPIDGTTNFIHANPMTCVSIGLLVNKKPVVGVIYAPCFNELYVAVSGKGSYLNGKRLQVSAAKAIKEAIIVNEFGYVRDSDGIRRACKCLENILCSIPHSLREYGSGVLDLAFVATGRVDAVFCGVAGNGWKPWDYAAGWLLVMEAGGVVKTLDGKTFHSHASSMICAATPTLLDELRVVLNQE